MSRASDNLVALRMMIQESIKEASNGEETPEEIVIAIPTGMAADIAQDLESNEEKLDAMHVGILDAFAGNAAVGLIANNGGQNPESISGQAYKIASAMVQTRGKIIEHQSQSRKNGD